MAKTFEYWESEELELTFGLTRVKNSPAFQSWVSAKCEIDPTKRSRLDELQNLLAERVDYWNEDELKFFFISQVVSMANFFSEKFSTFTQRPLFAVKKDVNGNDVELKGRVEFIVSRGKQHPRHPYFCIHEYKPEKRRDTDPLGQLLAAMLASRELNQTNHPIYGCYVNGRYWFFVLLEEDRYSLSSSFDATQQDLFDIFCILQECKNLISKIA